jgi:hypothetical protein
MPTKVQQRIEFSGPFFEKDPASTFRQNARLMLAGVAREGEAAIQSALQAGQGGRARISHGVTPDQVSEHAIGRVHNLSGKRWVMTAVISVNNRGFSQQQGVALMAAAASLESRYHIFRQTASALRSSRAQAVADLTAGLN